MNLGDIRRGLVASLEPTLGRDFQVLGYMTGSVRLPGIQMTPTLVEYDWHSQGGVHLIFTVQVLVGAVSDVTAQDILDEMLTTDGERSIKALIEADGTLGGVVSDVRVTGSTGARTFNLEGRPAAIGAEWEVAIFL